jgi:hypothetical protein
VVLQSCKRNQLPLPETEVLPYEFIEGNKKILTHNIPYTPSGLVEKFFVNYYYLTVEE